MLYDYEIDAPIDRKIPLLADLIFKGNWQMTKDTATTDDRNATLTIPFKGKNLRIISTVHMLASEAASKFILTFNDKPVPASSPIIIQRVRIG